MFKIFAAVVAALLLAPAPADAAHRRAVGTHLDPGCNVIFPCEIPETGQSHREARRRVVSPPDLPSYGRASENAPVTRIRGGTDGSSLIEHPAGCPWRAFCACGASVRVFGRAIRSLWPAAAWLRFPRAEPAPGRAAVWAHHIVVLEKHIRGDLWMVYDANSGRHRTHVHPRSIAGARVVDPHS